MERFCISSKATLSSITAALRGDAQLPCERIGPLSLCDHGSLPVYCQSLPGAQVEAHGFVVRAWIGVDGGRETTGPMLWSH